MARHRIPPQEPDAPRGRMTLDDDSLRAVRELDDWARRARAVVEDETVALSYRLRVAEDARRVWRAVVEPARVERTDTAYYVEACIRRGADALRGWRAYVASTAASDAYDLDAVGRSEARSVVDQISRAEPERARGLRAETVLVAMRAIVRGPGRPRSREAVVTWEVAIGAVLREMGIAVTADALAKSRSRRGRKR